MLLGSMVWVLASSGTAPAQNNDKVVVLSPRVGVVISKEQREYFHLFQQFKDFSMAVFFQAPDSHYYAVITRINRSSVSTDTIVNYSEASLLRYAEVIEHFEAISDGSYRMGDSPAKFEVVGGGIVYRESQVETPGTSIPPTSSPSRKDQDRLPLADDDPGIYLDDFPDWGCGFGYSAYYANLSGFTDAFAKIENKYREQGYSIHANTIGEDVSPLRWYSVRVRFSRSITAQLEAGKSSAERGIALEAVSGMVLYQFDAWAPGQIFPFLGAGISAFHISGEQNYGDIISKVDSSKTYPGSSYYYISYTALKSVSIEGTQIGLSVIAGLDIEPFPTFSLTPFAAYYVFPPLELDIDSWEVGRVHMSGLSLGARLTLNF